MKKKWVSAASLTIITAVLVLLLDIAGLIGPLENKAYDGWFYLRSEIGAGGATTEPVSVIVGIDDKTFDDPLFSIPQTLWHKYFEKVIMALADSGAKAICLDFLLPRAMFDDMTPKYSQAWLRAIFYAKRKGAPVIGGLIQLNDKQIAPDKKYLQIIEKKNMGLFNLTVDSDDFVRRQRLFILTGSEGDGHLFSLSLLAARALKSDLEPPKETIFIDFKINPTPFTRESFSELYHRAIAGDLEFFKSRFKDKVVFIGEIDSLTQDKHSTPLFHVIKKGSWRTPGVEIHAQTMDTLVNDRIFDEPDFRERGALYLLLAFLISVAAVYGDARKLPFWFLILFPIWAATCFISYLHYLILPFAGGAIAIILGQTLAFTWRHLVLDAEKRKIKAVFERYLPAKVVTHFISSKDDDFYRGESLRLCLLFSDIRGFTTYSENKEPTEVVGRLNEYFEAMAHVVVEEGGVVDKFLGDGLMAFFGALYNEENPSLSGVKAALAMLDNLDALNAQWEADGQETFRIGIGLHTGEVKVGNIGSEKKTEYTVIGDVVNLAARLQDKTKALGESIVISQEIFEEAGEFINVKDLGVTDIKGRAASRVYGLMSLKEEQT